MPQFRKAGIRDSSSLKRWRKSLYQRETSKDLYVSLLSISTDKLEICSFTVRSNLEFWYKIKLWPFYPNESNFQSRKYLMPKTSDFLMLLQARTLKLRSKELKKTKSDEETWFVTTWTTVLSLSNSKQLSQ